MKKEKIVCCGSRERRTFNLKIWGNEGRRRIEEIEKKEKKNISLESNILLFFLLDKWEIEEVEIRVKNKEENEKKVF